VRNLKSLFTGAATALAFGAIPSLAQGQSLLDVNITEAGDSAVTETIVLGLNKSTVVRFNNSAADIIITNPEIADAVVQTDRQMVFRGVAVGETNAFVFDAAGNQMLNLEIRVEPDVSALHDLIKRHVPEARVRAESVNSNIILTGLVDSLSQSESVVSLATAYLGADQSGEGIINMMEIAAKDQVLLQVRIVEMQRSVIKQLGIDVTSSTAFGTGVDGDLTGAVSAVSSQAFNVAGTALGGLGADAAFSNIFGDPDAALGLSFNALERVGIIRTLAEPNIVALSGEPANFLVGGEFPVPISQSNNGAISVEYRPFGVGLGFTPIVLSEGRISLRLSTEISDLSTVGSFTGQATVGVAADGTPVSIPGLTIPAVSVRRAETTVELPSGQSMMIAGLIDATTQQSLDSIPGIKNVPVLGALFRSRDYLNEESEMVVIVTPYLVDPTAPSNLRTPDEGFANASDAKTILFGKLNRLYGKGEAPVDVEKFTAPVGFIEE